MATFTKRIGITTDDGFKSNFSGGSYYTTFVNLGYYSAADQRIGVFRFQDVDIPNGATITSAKLTLYNPGSNLSAGYDLRIKCVDEDDTASFSSDPTGRSTTTDYGDWDTPTWDFQTTQDTADFTDAVQEVINRGGWSSGNSLGVFIYSRLTGNTGSFSIMDYASSTANCALLTITYDALSPSASASPSASQSPSSSKSSSTSSSSSVSPSESSSVSPSESPSVSPSASTSASASASYSPSPSAVQPFFGLKIAKDGIDAIATQEPYNFKFNSDYGTLKYLSKETAQVQFNAADGDIAGIAIVDHDLGYYPYVEVFVQNGATGNYEYCPFLNGGASVIYRANYKVTTSQIHLYADIIGISGSVWTFNFLVFIYKNNLNL